MMKNRAVLIIWDCVHKQVDDEAVSIVEQGFILMIITLILMICPTKIKKNRVPDGICKVSCLFCGYI